MFPINWENLNKNYMKRKKNLQLKTKFDKKFYSAYDANGQ